MSHPTIPPDLEGSAARFDSGVVSVTGVAADVIAQDVYVSKIIILPFATGTTPTLTVSDKAGTPNKYLNAVTAPATGAPTIIDFWPAAKFSGGVNAVAGGTAGPTVPIQVIGWRSAP